MGEQEGKINEGKKNPAEGKDGNSNLSDIPQKEQEADDNDGRQGSLEAFRATETRCKGKQHCPEKNHAFFQGKFLSEGHCIVFDAGQDYHSGDKRGKEEDRSEINDGNDDGDGYDPGYPSLEM